jgi:hypothetical protein
VVEDADDMGYFETGAVVEAQSAQGLPVFGNHARWGGAQLLRQGTESAVPLGEPGDFAPTVLLDGFDQFGLAMLGTQKLCVR